MTIMFYLCETLQTLHSACTGGCLPGPPVFPHLVGFFARMPVGFFPILLKVFLCSHRVSVVREGGLCWLVGGRMAGTVGVRCWCLCLPACAADGSVLFVCQPL